MLTKGEIEAINFENNTCTVRIPIFEGAGNMQKVSILALISTPPCEDMGYSVGDIVFVTFAENSLNKPVVLGKLLQPPKFQNLNNSTTVGKVSCNKLVVGDSCSLPTSTQLIANGLQSSMDNTGFGTIQDLINQVKAQQVLIDELKLRISRLEG